MSKNTKLPNIEKPRVHKDLDGFQYEINAFGELSSSRTIDELNKFLNENVQDKKFKPKERSEKK
jgi:hypothetical protein